MLRTIRATRAMAVAPHALASQSGRDILREGGNAAEAAIAMGATLCAVYPHMTGLGGDSFWLLHAPGEAVTAIDACGRTPGDLDATFYRERGLTSIPTRGPLAANTVAGTVSGWAAAHELSRVRWEGRLPVARLLADAIGHAQDGYVVSASQAQGTARHLTELAAQPGFSDLFLDQGRAPAVGSVMRQVQLAGTLRRLAQAGLDDFYRGDLALAIAADLARSGSPVGLADLAAHRAALTSPLSLRCRAGTLYNVPAPTQGLASLLILGIFERRLRPDLACDGADYVHLLVEATKQAFRVRDRYLEDPQDMPVDTQELLSPERLEQLAAALSMERAAPWQGEGNAGDTVWLGAIDAAGRAVSAIQSVYHEFGSALVLPGSGIVWQNRGASFTLEASGPRRLRPARKPFHTLNPALAQLDDGRVMVYGAMGGDGQPQTQAALFTRYVHFGRELQAAVSAPRWVLGRTWGSPSSALRLEARFPDALGEELRRRGHTLEWVGEYDEAMGHAGALVRRRDAVLEGAADPRSDGCVAAL